MAAESVNELQKILEKQLLDQYGPMLTGKPLSKVLGYPTYEAFRQSVVRDTVSVSVFRIKGRRGTFALTSDIAQWLAIQRVNGEIHSTTEEE